jgi:hypothetical protein
MRKGKIQAAVKDFDGWEIMKGLRNLKATRGMSLREVMENITVACAAEKSRQILFPFQAKIDKNDKAIR